MKDIFWCTHCLMPSTRPRITFDERGWCNACQWMEKKKTLYWVERFDQLAKNLEKYKSDDGHYDCLVAVSGGKDGSYVANQLKTKFKLNPLTVTIRPPLEMRLGNENLKNFIHSGYDHIHITPNAEVTRKLNKIGFIEKGFPYYGWVIAIHTAVARVAVNFGINLVFYAEDGEVEFGGNTDKVDQSVYSYYYQKKFVLEDSYEKLFEKIDIDDPSKLFFFKFPEDERIKNLAFTHWSYYENWDPYRNYLVAKEKCGLKESTDTNLSTFTNFAQNDQDLYALHTYLMYLKFGFGRATADACIEIRRGAMSRGQAKNLIKLYDGRYPLDYVESFLDHYEMSLDEFNTTLGKFANKKLFDLKDGKWLPKFSIK